jgi:acetyltransferase-like isoleucine patch superfamily enzyme
MSLLKRTFNIFRTYSRYDLPLWLVHLLTNWWPDFGQIPNIRGRLFSLFIGKCGKNFAVGRDVTILAPNRLVVGNDVYIAKGTWLNAFGNVDIEDEVMTGPYVVIASANHGFKNGSCRFGGIHPAPIKIGRGSWIGAHSVITAGVTIGRGNLIGANAVVTADTPDNVFAGGVPARVIGERKDNPSEIKSRHE